jgi:hypothetical protein
MKQTDFEQHLSMLLRDMPRATTADLADFAVAYWNGHQVTCCFLSEDDSGRIDEEFELDHYVWEDWKDAFAAWVEDPKFTVGREAVEDWLKDAPPFDAG